MNRTLTDAQLVEAAVRNFYSETLSDITADMDIPLSMFKTPKSRRSYVWRQTIDPAKRTISEKLVEGLKNWINSRWTRNLIFTP